LGFGVWDFGIWDFVHLQHWRVANAVLAPGHLLQAQLPDAVGVLEVDVVFLHEHPLLALC
jgi:hypothetical protein